MSRHFQGAIGCLPLLVCLAGWLSWVAPSAAAKPDNEVVIFRDAAVAPVGFAAAEIRRALRQNGLSVVERDLDQGIGEGPAQTRAPQRVVLAVAGAESAAGAWAEARVRSTETPAEQAYRIKITAERTSHGGRTTYWVISGDAIGAMYGGLHLGETIRLNRGLRGIKEVSRAPYILRRGIKFNIPLDARTPSYDDTGDAAQKNYVHMWDLAFWEQFLDEMARHRYNTLTLWNLHPFPSIVKCPSYPDVALDDVCLTTLKPSYKAGAWRDPQFVYPPVFEHLKVVKRMSIEEKIAFWRRVMQHAKDRGIDVYFITWNVLTNGTQGKYGITNDQDNPTTIAYLRECVCQCLLTYPLLAGIGVTAGENMRNRKDEFAREKWLWRTYGLGVADAKKRQPGRHVRFLHRVWQTGLGEVMREFGSKYPDTFELGFKYARAHMYSSTKPPFCEALCEELKRHGVKCWWNLRNDDIFNFRWGDPDYAREFLRNLPPEELTAGYHMGSDGYVWGREHTSRRAESPRRLEIKKHWYRFMLWGRLGYDPELDRAFFERVLTARFAQVSGPAMYDAWASASKIIPLVNRFHWNDWDFMWAVEICSDQRHGFHTVDDFIRIPPMPQSGILAIPAYVDRQLAGQPVGDTTPPQVAEQLRTHARTALDLVARIRREAPDPAEELRLTLGDIEAMAHLGNYYAAKILGAVELCAFRKTGDETRRKAACRRLVEAVGHWQRYARIATGQYRPQLLARTRRTDWMSILDDVRRDVRLAADAESNDSRRRG